MMFLSGFALATVLSVIGWYFFPRICEKETIIFKDALSDIKHLEAKAIDCVKQVQEKYGAMEGEFKRSQAFRMMQQLHPLEKERDIVLAIELAVRKCLGR